MESVKTKEGLDKNNKYDRQLRLWGDHGQTALETARVCLINATATGTEILKNLILPVVESHPDSSFEDLRLDRPFPGLHGGDMPRVYKEKNQLKELIKQGIRTNEDGIQEEEENFDEAVKAVNSALTPTRIPSHVDQLFNYPECVNLHTESSNFWVLVRAVKDFVENEGQGALPVRGSIPDMTADSERYIALQRVYHDKADRDTAIVSQRCHDLLHSIGRHMDDEECDDVVYYVLLRAVDRFYEKYNTYPGWFANQVEADVGKLKSCLTKLCQDWGVTCNIKDDFVHEICRYGASELHTVSAFIGGSAAQEAIKVITHQFIPFNNTFIYNAMKQTSVTVEL
ncbi:ULA1-like protein [Mya arenaria]|uniref:ULA1-like protein n=1 Tax=Mya arenaria TaxID=6604 RepID=A0ABY7EWI2_MYAAR|nr:ULA1-like protein [Mya arenaria]